MFLKAELIRYKPEKLKNLNLFKGSDHSFHPETSKTQQVFQLPSLSEVCKSMQLSPLHLIGMDLALPATTAVLSPILPQRIGSSMDVNQCHPTHVWGTVPPCNSWRSSPSCFLKICCFQNKISNPGVITFSTTLLTIINSSFLQT